MNSKMKKAVCYGIILITLAGLCLADSPQQAALTVKMTDRTQVNNQIIHQVDKLASNNVPASVVFAAELVKVLKTNKVELPERLAKLKAPKPPLPGYEEMAESIYNPTHKIHEFCVNSTYVKDPNILPVPLRNGLLETIACHCPHGYNRFESAKWLYDRIDEYPDVPVKLAHKATVAASSYILDRASKGKIKRKDSMIVLIGIALCANHIALESMIADKPSKEALDKIIAEYEAKTDALLKTAKDEELISALTRGKEGFSKIKQMAEVWVMVSTVRKGLEPVIKGFIDAANKEDKKAAAKYVTGKTAEGLLSVESLRDTISHTKGRKVKKIKYLFLGNPSVGKVQNGRMIVDSIEVRLELICSQGPPIKTKRDLPVVKTKSGWLIGRE